MFNEEKKERIIDLLKATKRKGIKNLIEYLLKEGFFTSPASSKYHLSCEGGLAQHSYNVFSLYSEMLGKFRYKVPFDTIIICSFLHDICKIGAYMGIEKPYLYNKQQPKGHGLLSIERIEKYIKLTKLEKLIIKYHMSYYYAKEFTSKGEYDMAELNTAQVRPEILLFYFCDHMSSKFLED